MMRLSRLLGCALALVCLDSPATPARAQEPSQPGTPAAPTPEARASKGIETITIVAEKAEAELQDVALSVQAFRAGDLERRGVQSALDLEGMIPGMTFIAAGNSQAQMAIASRGMFNAITHPLEDQKVGTYVDGVYVGNGNSTIFDLFDVERIEFLKGPQGTLFGRNSTGGAINIISAKPQPELGGRARIRIGQRNQRDVAGMLNVPLIGETLLARISLLRTQRDGFWKNVPPGPKAELSDDDDKAVRAALRYLPAPDVTVDYAFEWTETREHAPLIVVHTAWQQIPCASFGVCDELGRMNLAFLAPPIPTHDWRDPGDQTWNGTSTGLFMDRNLWNHSYAITWDAHENAQVKLLGGWRRYNLGQDFDQDATIHTLGHFGDHARERSFNTEIQVLGSAFEGRVEYVAGVNWFENEFDISSFRDIYNDTPLNLAYAVRQQGDSYALGYFTQLAFRLTDRLELTTGLRYSTERKAVIVDLCNGTTNGFIRVHDCPVPPDGINNGFGARNDDRFDAWTPMIRLKYDWTDSLMSYIKWSKGYNAGGYNSLSSTLAPSSRAPYDEEKLYSWEAGFKSLWFDDRLQVNAAAFYDELVDGQVSIWSPSTGSSIRQNAGEARIRGFELDMRALLLEGLEVSLAHAWTYATYSEWLTPDPSTGAIVNVADERVFSHTPKRRWAGSIRYTFPETDFGTLDVSASFVREGEKYTLQEKIQNAAIKTTKHTVYQGRITLNDALGYEGLSLAVAGRNLTDRAYRNGQGVDFSPLGWAWNRIGDPRQVFFELGYEF